MDSFAVALPDNWTGQFLQQGGGGLNGSVGEPRGAQAAGEKPRWRAVSRSPPAIPGTRAQAAGSTEASCRISRRPWTSSTSRSGEWRSRETDHRELLRQPPAHSYYVGCSTGGREAMLMSQRYPLYFDGIVAGAPAMRTGHSNLATRTVTVASERSRRKERMEAGFPAVTLRWRSEGNHRETPRCLDARDGVKDGMVFDVTGCTFKPADLQCPGAKTDGCLSQEQVAAIRTHLRVRRIRAATRSIPASSSIRASPQRAAAFPACSLPATARSGLRRPLDRTSTPKPRREFQSGSAYRRHVTWMNLKTFSSHGGKLIFYHGVSDPWFSAKDTIDYYQRMSSQWRRRKSKDWSRLFLSPGMGHCNGGSAALDTFDMLTAAVNWVEKNMPPDSIMATGRAFPGRSRPLCAFPAHAQYNGSGDTENASNYSCRP